MNSRSISQASSHEALNIVNGIRQKTEHQLMQMQNELRHCQQTISSLAYIDDAGQKLVDLAFENSKIRDELDVQLKVNEQLKVEKRKAIQKRDDEIGELRRQVMILQEERDSFLHKCQQLEEHADQEESRFYQEGLNSSAEPLQRPKRIQQQATSHEVSKLNDLFDRMELTDAMAISIMNETQTVANQLDEHSKRIAVHHTGVVALYDQLKHTAKFLGQIVNSVGLSSSQIDLLMQKINQLELEIQESNDMSVKIATETKQLADEVSNMSTHIEQTIRQNATDVGFQSSFVNNSRSTKAFDDLLAKNAELIKRDKLLSDKIEDLKCQVVDIETDRNSYQAQMTSLGKEKRELYEKLASAMKMLQERNDELENRQNIIQQLKQLGAGDYNQTPPSDHLKDDIEDQLRHIYTTLSKVSHKVQKKN